MMMSASDRRSSAETGTGSDSRHPSAAVDNDASHLSFGSHEAGCRADKQREMQERSADHQEQLELIERDIAEAREYPKYLYRQLDAGEITSDQFHDGNNRIGQQIEEMEHERSRLRKKVDEATPSSDSESAEAEIQGDNDYSPTLTQVRTTLGEAYIEQSKISDRLMLLTEKSSTGRSSQQEEDEILTCEELLRVNTDQLTQLEQEIARAQPNDPPIGVKPAILKLNNIPPSASTSRQTSPDRSPAQQPQSAPIMNDAEPSSNILKTADNMSTPVDPHEIARRLQSAVNTTTNVDQTSPDSTHFEGLAITRHQVGIVLDRVQERAPGPERLSVHSSAGSGAPHHRPPHTSYHARPQAQQVNVITQPTPGTTPAVRTTSVSSFTSERRGMRHGLHNYVKNITPMTFTGKPGQTIGRFLKQMDRYIRQTEIDTEEEMTDHLHAYLSEDIRTSLTNALTEETEYDYAAQVDLLRRWWTRSRDPRPLMDQYHKITYTPSEDLDSYASRIERGRRAGWPRESMTRNRGFHSEYETAIMKGFLKGLPKQLQRMIRASGKLDDIELHQSDFKELVEFTRIQMRKLTRKEQPSCSDCGRGCEQATPDCPTRSRINTLAGYSGTVTPVTNVEPDGVVDYAAYQEPQQTCAMFMSPVPTPHPYPQQQQQQPFRQQRPQNNKQQLFHGQEAKNNFQAATNPARFSNQGAWHKKLEGHYNRDERGHLTPSCPHLVKTRTPTNSSDLSGIVESLNAVRKAIFVRCQTANGPHSETLQQKAKALDEVINTVQDDLESLEKSDIVPPTKTSDPLNS